MEPLRDNLLVGGGVIMVPFNLIGIISKLRISPYLELSCTQSIIHKLNVFNLTMLLGGYHRDSEPLTYLLCDLLPETARIDHNSVNTVPLPKGLDLVAKGGDILALSDNLLDQIGVWRLL